jgi:dTDP-4-dehydrorhamnose 3,5-epimerase
VIPGVERRRLEPHADQRGTLTELWRSSALPFQPQQLIVTASAAGSLRGMHLHLKQLDLMHVVSGRVFIALIDLRADPVEKDELWLDGTETILIPPGVAHGYATPERAVVLYLLSLESDGADEFGFRWSDPEAAIDWPVTAPLLSARDSNAGTLRAARALARSRPV